MVRFSLRYSTLALLFCCIKTALSHPLPQYSTVLYTIVYTCITTAEITTETSCKGRMAGSLERMLNKASAIKHLKITVVSAQTLNSWHFFPA